jgi:hypothetical protein
MSMVLLLAAFLAAVLGSALLALSQPRHWQSVTSTTARPAKAAHRLGCGLVFTSLLLTILRDGASFGGLSWPMLIGFSAVITALLLTFAPNTLRPLAQLIMPRKP